MQWLRMAVCAAQHQGDRDEQQDRVAILSSDLDPRCALGVLADGLSGRSGGALAAENALLTCQSRFRNFTPSAEPVDAFFRSLVDEAHTVLKLAALTSRLEPHTTFAAVLIQPDRVDWCHVGDSRVYHLRDAAVARRTQDHTLARRLAREGIEPSAPLPRNRAADRLVHSLGARERPDADIDGIADPRAGDAFLICSDGLWCHVEEAEIAAIVAGQPVREAAETLVALARERARGRGDNCSLVLVRLED
ncbi:MAG: protein phosphatase 2C domain-containing protein [Pseudomonadota bacterium]|jgi:serine/threonine protein phosphatase PrpC|nr:protein phosphatase 2C domain-containing protein [Pseudomonadota bacterium]